MARMTASCFRACAALGLAVGAVAGEAQRPNVLFILCDDLGWGDLGCQGHPTQQTPRIDALAAAGLRCTQATVASPICSPSRAAFLTGRYPAREGIHWVFRDPANNAVRNMPNRLDPLRPTLPGLLKAAGYTTGHIGKWHLGPLRGSPSPLTEHGFDYSDPIEHGFGYEKPGEADPRDGGAAPDREDHGSEQVASSALMAERALAFLERNAQQPFYLQIWTHVPHTPLQCTPEQLAPFRTLQIDPQAAAYAPWMGPYLEAMGRNRDMRARTHHAAMHDLDTQIGRILDRLEQLGLAQRTIVILTGDNGPTHGGTGSAGPFRGRKHTLWEGGLRVPFIVRWPGHVPAGSVDSRSPLNGVDLLPSVAALCGVTPPADIDGVDRSPVWLGTPSARTKPLYWEFLYRCGDPQEQAPPLAIRDGDHKLLTDKAGKRTELYDLAADPSEQHDLATTHPASAAALRQRVLSWQASLPANPARTAWRRPLGWDGK